MNEGDKFWIAIWRTVGAVVLGIAVTIASCDYQQNVKIVELVKAGADPMEAICAINGGNGTYRCMVTATKAGAK